jgi:small-conductance mechanosensitive channel
MWWHFFELEPSAALRRFCWLRNTGNGSDVRAFSALPCSLTAKLAQRSGNNRNNRGLLLSGALFAGALMAAIVTMAGLAHGQPAPESPPVASEETPAAAIPLADLVTESESLSEVIRDIRADLSADRIIEEVAQRLPAITREIDGRLRENRKIVAQNPSIEMLSGFEGEWSRLRRELATLNSVLTDRINKLERAVVQLEGRAKTWNQTLAAAKESSAPVEVLGRLEEVITELRQGRREVEKQRARALTVQSRVGVQDSRVADALMSIREAREKALDRLFLPDTPPIWSLAPSSSTVQDLRTETVNSFFRQWGALRAYAERQTMRFVLAVVVLVVLAAAFFWLRKRMRRLEAEAAAPTRAARAFEAPVAAALLLVLIGSRWIFPEAPRLLWAILGALALVPSVIILRRFMSSDLYPVLYALVAFFVLDRVRTLAAAIEFLPRLLFLAQMAGVIAFSLWIARSVGRTPSSTPQGARPRQMISMAGYVALAISSAAFIANVFGYVTLANLLGNALLQSAYLALILYAIVEVFDGLVTVALSSPPFALLGTISRHRALWRRRIQRALLLLAVILWVLAVLQRLMLRDKLFAAVHRFLTAELSFGSIQISLGDVLAFAITVWAAFLISRFVRCLLDEDIYPRVRLKRGLSYAISNTLHYLILLVGFFLAVAALGFDMTRVTILAGAFSVGVGFGLQNVFNNFVSGLILLFERPINIGDVVQIEDASGVVERIGVRASIIRATNGSEIIMPNGKLISERLINWTLSSHRHGIELPIGVAQGTDPGRVIALLERTAAGHPLVTGDPPPQALVVKLGADSLDFELRAWTDHSEQWMQIRSELAIAISSALGAEKITLR